MMHGRPRGEGKVATLVLSMNLKQASTSSEDTRCSVLAAGRFQLPITKEDQNLHLHLHLSFESKVSKTEAPRTRKRNKNLMEHRCKARLETM
jgi:hypothetical protein